jgi:hypothetical protein
MKRTPLLWPSVLTPSQETSETKALYAQLTGVEYSVKAWEAALCLYRTAIKPPSTIPRDIADRWRWIACNECVLELYHLRSRLAKVQSVQLRKCPTLRQWIDISAIRGARKKLDEYFPDIEALRHATAHKGENEAHPEKHAPGGRLALTGFREPNRYSAPYLGKMRSIDITDESLRRIEEVVDTYLGAFERAASELEQQGHVE